MAISEARKRANKKWNDAHMKEAYDRISVLVPKGKKEIIQSVATANNESVNAMINRLIETELERYYQTHPDSVAGSSGIQTEDDL